ncbi:MAG: hypothetical protein H6849_04285 [Alphaproteobacteria bacterium]|nr:MAG: hypothetical protein H6849_04285 [Alphaproteobacteria bacterium]
MNRYSNLYILNLINEIEDKFPVDVWSVNEIKIWPLIRNSFCSSMLSKHRSIKLTKQTKINKYINVIKLPFVAVIFITKLLMKILFKGECEVMYLSDGVSRMVFDKGYDKFCDPLHDTLSEKEPGIIGLYFSQLSFKDSQLRSKYTSLEILHEISYFIARIYCKIIKIESLLPEYEDFLKFIDKHELESFYRKDIIVQNAIMIKICAFVFDLVIKLKKIKKSYIVCYYGILGYALSLSSRKNDIDLYEIQHGTIVNCPAYHKWNKVPDDGYALVPNKFLLWDDISVRTFNTENSYNFTKIRTAEEFGLIPLKSKKIKSYINNQAAEVLEIAKNFKAMIFVSLQPQFYGQNDWDVLAEFIKKCNESYLWWIRPHVAYKDSFGLEKVSSLCGSNIFIDNGDYSIYSILDNAKLMITTASATVIESCIYKIPSLLLSETGFEDFINYIDSGNAKYIKNKDRINDYIVSCL